MYYGVEIQIQKSMNPANFFKYLIINNKQKAYMLPGLDLNRSNPETIHDPFRSSFIFTPKTHKIKSWLYP
jgi:hypothetical protein